MLFTPPAAASSLSSGTRAPCRTPIARRCAPALGLQHRSRAEIGHGGGPGAYSGAEADDPRRDRQIVADYARAARNAMNAGFDGVQIQANYLYLLAQFLNRDQPPDRMAAG
jgi:hypothetical protein